MRVTQKQNAVNKALLCDSATHLRPNTKLRQHNLEPDCGSAVANTAVGLQTPVP